MNQSLATHTVASAGILLAASSSTADSAVIIEREIVSTVAAEDFDFLFDPIDDATDLVEFSDGSVTTIEGGTFIVNSINDDDSLTELYRRDLQQFDNVHLALLDMDDFTDLDPARTIKGLNLQVIDSLGQGSVNFPANTIVSFSAIPEPSSLLSAIVGLFLIGHRRRR